MKIPVQACTVRLLRPRSPLLSPVVHSISFTLHTVTKPPFVKPVWEQK